MKKGNLISNIILSLIFGIIGAWLFNFFLFPRILESNFSKNSQLEKVFKQEVNVYPEKKIFIQENQSLIELSKQVEKATFVLINGNQASFGVLLTTDGLGLANSDFINSKTDIVYGGKKIKYKILKRDKKLNLALLKLSDSNFTTLKFADFDKIFPGQKIFLYQYYLNCQLKPEKKILPEIIEKIDCSNIYIYNNRKDWQNSGVFDYQTNLIGLTYFSNGNLKILPVKEIKKFANL